VERAFATGNPVPFDVLMRSGGTICPWLASVTFGGPDLRTAYLGGLRSANIPAFDSRLLAFHGALVSGATGTFPLLAGKRILVTGAASGIGLGAAQAF